MSDQRFSRIGVAAIALAAAAMASACAANQPAPGSDDRAGSFHALMAAKMPGVFGPHLPAADEPSTSASSGPATGSFEAVMGTKMPGVYGTHLAAADAPAAPVHGLSDTCRNGSFASLMAAKLPPNARPGNPDLYRDCR